jgi:Leucine-rich repeat (LRR) protein
MKFTSLLKSLIVEQSRFEILLNALTKHGEDKKGNKTKPKLSKKEFLELVLADPTTRLNNVDVETATAEELSKIKAGSYVPWLVKHYLLPKTESNPEDYSYERDLKNAKELFLEDLYSVTNDLKKFERFKGALPKDLRDINKLTPDQLYDAVKDFSLEKTKATSQEKEEASKTYSHPGADIVFRGNDWTVAKITDQSQLGKDAACFYGGYGLEPSKGESKWCTSSPGLDWFKNYISAGPLYVIIPNKSESGRFGEKSGLPAERYQFNFPKDQFMDAHNRQQNVVNLLNGSMSELKDYFKPEFAKGLTGTSGKDFKVDGLSSGAVGKFISLYGLNDLIGSLPDTLENFSIVNRDNNQIVNIELPQELSKFKNLLNIMTDNILFSSIPDSICNMKNLRFLAIMKNPELTVVPECIGNLPNIMFLNLRDSPNAKIPSSITEKAENLGNGMWDFGDF